METDALMAFLLTALQQTAHPGRKLERVHSIFAKVAELACQLDVTDGVRPTVDNRHDVIGMKLLSDPLETVDTAAALLSEQILYLSAGMLAF
jgi:hypothetical protein